VYSGAMELWKVTGVDRYLIEWVKRKRRSPNVKAQQSRFTRPYFGVARAPSRTTYVDWKNETVPVSTLVGAVVKIESHFGCGWDKDAGHYLNLRD
jgi:hypothetical protein